MTEESCPSCGKTNPPGTPKCQCGRALVHEPNADKPIEPAPPPDAMIPRTEIRRVAPKEPPPEKPQPPAQGMSLPQAGHSQQEFTASNPTPLPAAPPTEPPRTTTSARRRMSLAKSGLSAVVLLALGAAGAWFLNQRRAAQRPEVVVPKLAEQYLTALSQNDFATAYGMLSAAAQAQSSLDEFRQLRGTEPWTWSNISIASREPDAVLISYDLSLSGARAKKDYLLFVLQPNGQWVRPYNWGLLKKIESAFDRSDPDMAMILAQAAVNVDARDPMARGYLCEALYYRKLPDQAAKECEEALILASKYPSSLTPKSLYHLYAILGDTYANSLKLYDKAADDYGRMLRFPELSADDQCQLLLARADSFSKSSNPQGELADLTSAAAVCNKQEDQQFIARRRAELTH